MKKTFIYNVTSDNNGIININTENIITDMFSTEGFFVSLVDETILDLDLYILSSTTNEVLSAIQDSELALKEQSAKPKEENNTLRFYYKHKLISNYKNTVHKVTVNYYTE
jgi:hypothetical protein